MTHDQSAQHCRSGHTPCTGLFLSPVHHARHKVCRLLLFTSTHTENEVLSMENPNPTPSAAQQADIPLLHKPVRPARLRALLQRKTQG